MRNDKVRFAADARREAHSLFAIEKRGRRRVGFYRDSVQVNPDVPRSLTLNLTRSTIDVAENLTYQKRVAVFRPSETNSVTSVFQVHRDRAAKSSLAEAKSATKCGSERRVKGRVKGDHQGGVKGDYWSGAEAHGPAGL